MDLGYHRLCMDVYASELDSCAKVVQALGDYDQDNVDYSIEPVEGILIIQLIFKRAERLVKNYRSLWAERVERRLYPNSFGFFF